MNIHGFTDGVSDYRHKYRIKDIGQERMIIDISEQSFLRGIINNPDLYPYSELFKDSYFVNKLNNNYPYTLFLPMNVIANDRNLLRRHLLNYKLSPETLLNSRAFVFQTETTDVVYTLSKDGETLTLNGSLLLDIIPVGNSMIYIIDKPLYEHH